MIDLDREEFEKLPEISKRLQHGDVFFNSTCYKSKNSSYRRATFINGAWYAYQEQQKKLDCCREENKALLSKLNIPDGYKLVPVDPTDEMINTYRDKSIAPISTLSVIGYKAMIGASE